VFVHFPGRESTSPNILIRGKPSVLPEAEKAFEQLVEEAKENQNQGTHSTPKEAAHTESLQIKPEHLGGVIGRKGHNIRGISDISGTRVDVDNKNNKLVISGPKEGVEFAVKEFKDLIAELEVTNPSKCKYTRRKSPADKKYKGRGKEKKGKEQNN